MGKQTAFKKIGIFVALLITLSVVSAANVGVSPATINFRNVLRGGYAERPIAVTIDTLAPTDISISKWGDIKDWLEFSEDSLTVVRNAPGRLTVSVRPPSDVPNGNYTGFIRINTTRLGSESTGAIASSIIPTLDLLVNVEITDTEILECTAANFIINSAEEGDDIIFTAEVQNRGNIRFWPEFVFEIWDQASLNVVKRISYAEQLVVPTQSKKITIRIPTKDLVIGQYWADISATQCFNKQTLTFDVLEEGALRADGSLESIVVEPWADVNDIVTINANFKNTGEKPLDAIFKGQIIYQNKIVQLLESDQSLLIPLDGQETFQFFFTPKKAGKYIISGRVFYDNKRTYEKSAIVNVRPTSIWSVVIKITIYAVLLIIIAVLIYKIRRERRSYLARAKMLRRK